MKTRKNKSQHEECLKKLKEIYEYSERYLTQIISNMIKKEKIKRLAIEVHNLEFERNIQANKTERNKIEVKIKEKIKAYENSNIKPPMSLPVTKEIIQTPIIPHKIDNNIPKQGEDIKKDIKRKPVPIIHHEQGKDLVRKEIEKRAKMEREIANYFHFRIRYNKLGNPVIDRYIKSEKSTCPFNESFDQLLMSELKEEKDLQMRKNSKIIIYTSRSYQRF